MQSVIHLEQLRKSYYLGKQELPVLKGIDLDIQKNEFVALMGPSGSGKSTLMNLITKTDILAENKLFATLDTTVRKVVIKNGEIRFTSEGYSGNPGQLVDELTDVINALKNE